jgi:hypothetical protein
MDSPNIYISQEYYSIIHREIEQSLYLKIK